MAENMKIGQCYEHPEAKYNTAREYFLINYDVHLTPEHLMRLRILTPSVRVLTALSSTIFMRCAASICVFECSICKNNFISHTTSNLTFPSLVGSTLDNKFFFYFFSFSHPRDTLTSNLKSLIIEQQREW